MEWKSFVALKHGRRQIPRLPDLDELASILAVEPGFVFQVARGFPAEEVAGLLAREHRLRAVLDRVTDAVFTIDRGGVVQDVNQRFCEMTGRTAAELVGHALVDVIAPESTPALLAAIAAVARDGSASGLELVVRAPNGVERLLQLDATRISGPNAEILGAQAIARDVTGQRQLVRSLDEQRRALQVIFDGIPAACILFESSGRISAANPLVASVCHVTAAEMLGRDATAVFGNPGPTGCPVTRSFMTAKVEQQVSWMTNKLGQHVFVHRTAGPILVDGKVDKVIEILVDVTDQIQRGDLRVLAFWRGQPDQEANERRSFPRIPVLFSADCRIARRRHKATVENLSANGLCIQTDTHIPKGTVIEFEWALPSDGVAVRATGVVVWTRRPAVGRPGGAGVMFRSIAPPALAAREGEKRSA